jgi:uncharacterized protein (TIGR03663 family)
MTEPNNMYPAHSVCRSKTAHEVCRIHWIVAFVIILAIAAAARLSYLNYRPMHADEANQAVKTGDLWTTGRYHYDTADHHGPTLYYLTLPSLWLSGAKAFAETSGADYRVVPALFGVAAIALLPLFFDGLGWWGVLAAALCMAVSPAFVYYARYYIQETLLVFFTLAALGCGWRFARSRNPLWLIAAGLSVGLMHATKETWIFSAAAAACGFAMCLLWNRILQGSWPNLAPYFFPRGRMLVQLAACGIALLAPIAIAAILFSGFGQNRQGPWNSITAYASYWHRSGLPEHTEKWYYYLQILFAFRPNRGFFWSEGATAAWACIGAVFSFQFSVFSMRTSQRSCGLLELKTENCKLQTPTKSDFGRFLTVYTLALLSIYSLISYKTPWCGLSILCGVVLLAGFGLDAIAIGTLYAEFRFQPSNKTDCPLPSASCILPTSYRLLPTACCLLFAATIAHLGWQAYRLNGRFAADVRNPYVYAHTPPGLADFAQRLDHMADRLPAGHELTIHVVVPESYWPLPWYLRRFDDKRVGYWLDADRWKRDYATADRPAIALIAEDFSPAADKLLGIDGSPGYNRQMLISLRPGMFVRVYVRSDLWSEMIK